MNLGTGRVVKFIGPWIGAFMVNGRLTSSVINDHHPPVLPRTVVGSFVQQVLVSTTRHFTVTFSREGALKQLPCLSCSQAMDLFS